MFCHHGGSTLNMFLINKFYFLLTVLYKLRIPPPLLSPGSWWSAITDVWQMFESWMDHFARDASSDERMFRSCQTLPMIRALRLHQWTLLGKGAAHLCGQVRPGSSCWCRRAREAGLQRGRPVTGWTAPLIDRSQNKCPPGWAASEAGPLCREGAGSQCGLKENKRTATR